MNSPANYLFLTLQALFFSLVFLHRANIWLISVAYPTYTYFAVGVYILLLSIAATRTRFFVPSWRTFALFSIGLVLIILARFHTALDGDANYELGEGRAIAAYVLISALTLVMASTWTESQERFIVKFYVLVCTIVSILGIAAWAIVLKDWFSAEYVDAAHLIDIHSYSGGRVIRNDGAPGSVNIVGLEQNVYSFPYSLGLILTSSYLYDVLGFQYFRASGSFHEPVYNWILIIPAFLLTLSGGYFKGLPRLALLCVQVTFLVAISSLSILVAVISVLLLYRVLVLISRKFTLRKIMLQLSMLIAFMAALVLFTVQLLDESGAADGAASIVAHKVGSNDYIAIALGVLGNSFSGGAFIYLFIVATACLWVAVRFNSRPTIALSMVVLACLIVSLKGAFDVLLVRTPGFIILFFMMVRQFDYFFFSERSISARNRLSSEMLAGTQRFTAAKEDA